MRGIFRSITVGSCLVAAAVLSACGDSGSTTVPPTPTPPAANVTVSADGNLVLYPSADTAFKFALGIPLQIQETGGGSAVWNFFRVSFFLNGLQVERREAGAGEIAANGFADINPNATTNPQPLIRFNSEDFDDVELLLSFTDKNTGAVTERMLDLAEFGGLEVDLTPVRLPGGADFLIR